MEGWSQRHAGRRKMSRHKALSIDPAIACGYVLSGR
jgi:hypothetical protein